MSQYHRNNGEYRQNNNKRYSHSRNRGRGYNAKKNTISIDKLIAKAVDNKPVNMFVDDYEYSQFQITKVLKRNAYSKGYSNPTKIQYKAIPEILNGKDILGVATTGSGKTAAFLIPLIDKVVREKSNRVLIVVPTRELAMQIQDEFRSLAKDTQIKSVLIMGGNSINTQISILKSNPNFIIATPGRLKDLTDRRVINLATINNVVLDEVDRMLDMGFIQDIKFIIEKLNKERQSLFFSATLNRKSEEIARTLLHNPVRIEIETQGPGKNVDQDVVRLQKGQSKFDVLVGLLEKDSLEKVLIFTSTKWGADKLCKSLRLKDIYIESLHGGKRQNKRTRIIEEFKNGKIDVLVATDVASRGLDVDNISHVINYDMPQSYDDYIHRIGRTGRAGKKGFALTFV
ncbi:MAG TPA: DEAD/DEAH box helicase [Candidatus Dojkabacteria bacterium]|nr:DEAD/DEAH box helicase [Candidatus Dojkabacteria bacterium]